MINDSTIMGVLESAVKAEGLRQEALANNIANINTSGYRRLDTNFEEVFQKALGKNQDLDPQQLDFKLKETLDLPINEFGNDVSLDNETGQMVENSLRHRAFMLILKKKYSQMTDALRF